MSVSYAPRLIWIPAEPDAGVVFHRHSIASNGSIGAPRYWSHAGGGWETSFQPARHVRKLTRGLTAVARSVQAFAIPLDVATDPAASASVFLLGDDGAVRSVLTTISAVDLAGAAVAAIGLAP